MNRLQHTLLALALALVSTTAPATTPSSLAGVCAGNAMRLADALEQIVAQDPSEENRNLYRYFRDQQTDYYRRWGSAPDFLPAATYSYNQSARVEDRLRIADRCKTSVR